MAAIPRAGAAVVAVATALHAVPCHAQAYFVQGNAHLTVEAFGNLTAGDASGGPDTAADDLRLDGALRLLGRIDSETAPDLGIRVVVQTSPEEQLETGETSILLLSKSGRLEFGERMGLPDVLTGYAPNNFTFTSADFGPPSGPSLDPAGGLQTAFLAPELAAAIAPLTVLGFTASLAEDQSTKLLYVSPKRRGLLGGLSFAADATDRRFAELAQFGLTHERYWRENVFRWGGSYSFARGRADAQDGPFGDLHSANVGATIVIGDSLTLGASATFNGNSGLPDAPLATDPSDAWGVVASVNYNVGPWTVGAYGQRAQSEGDVDGPGDDRLNAVQVGVSYRWSTHLRAYAAWFHYDFDDEGGKTAATRHSGDVLIAGLRLAL